jgi:tetratricopeptide (TPR) repeat protein
VSQNDANPAEAGARLLDKRRPGPAMAALREALSRNPEDHDSRLRLGRAHLMAADPFGAVSVLEELYACAPDHPQAAEALAGAYRRDARHHDVLALAAKIAAPSVQMRYDVGMALSALGRAAEALAAFDAALLGKPDLAAAWYASHGPALDELGWNAAHERLLKASACSGANRKYAGMLAAYQVLLEPGNATGHIDGAPSAHRYLAEGAAAILPHFGREHRLFGVSGNLLRWVLGQARQPGLVLEFGVRRGASLTILAETAGQEVHGFDSFEGLPENWVNTQSGVLTTGSRLPDVPANARLHAGWFEDSLPPFFAAHPGPLRFANIDSDIYSSACTVLAALEDRLRPGSILVFDEFIGNRSWRDDEFRAFHEFAARTGWSWRIIAAGPATKQVAVLLGA